MKIKYFPYFIAILLSFSLSSFGQTGEASSKPQITESYSDGLLKVYQKFLELTPEQTLQAKKVLGIYREKFNAMANSTQNIDQYKAELVKLDIDRIHQYKAFLTKDQYDKLVARYNKYHSKSQIE